MHDPSLLHSGREGFWSLAPLPFHGSLEWLEGASPVDVHDGVELLRQSDVKVVAQPLRFWLVDDPDGTLEPGFSQIASQFAQVSQEKQKPWCAAQVEEFFIASGQSRPDLLSLRRPTPIRSPSDRAPVRAEADEDRIAGMALTGGAGRDIELASIAHLRGAGIAHVRVVRPDQRPSAFSRRRPKCARSASSMSAMCVSHKFQEEIRPWNIER